MKFIFRICNLAPVRNGLFSWIHSLITLSDGILLPLAGFDGYSTIQSLKLTFGLLLFMSIPALFFLVPFYYSQSDQTDIKYLSFSIINIYGRAAWVPTIFCWIVSLVTFYVIFVFYRNFATLRQIYLNNPSSLMSFAHLRKITDDFGSLQDSRTYFNVTTRSVIIHSISANYGPKELKRLLEGAGIGPVESIQQINSSAKVEEMMTNRNNLLTQLERELLAFYTALKTSCLKEGTPEWRAMQEVCCVCAATHSARNTEQTRTSGSLAATYSLSSSALGSSGTCRQMSSAAMLLSRDGEPLRRANLHRAYVRSTTAHDLNLRNARVG